MVGSSSGIRQVMEAVRRAAPTNATVLIQGESGVGKELVARAIHALSDRREEPMLYLNCAALATELTEEKCDFWHFRFSANVTQRVATAEEALARSWEAFLDDILSVTVDGHYAYVSTVYYGGLRIIDISNETMPRRRRSVIGSRGRGGPVRPTVLRRSGKPPGARPRAGRPDDLYRMRSEPGVA